MKIRVSENIIDIRHLKMKFRHFDFVTYQSCVIWRKILPTQSAVRRYYFGFCRTLPIALLRLFVKTNGDKNQYHFRSFLYSIVLLLVSQLKCELKKFEGKSEFTRLRIHVGNGFHRSEMKSTRWLCSELLPSQRLIPWKYPKSLLKKILILLNPHNLVPFLISDFQARTALLRQPRSLQDPKILPQVGKHFDSVHPQVFLEPTSEPRNAIQVGVLMPMTRNLRQLSDENW